MSTKLLATSYVREHMAEVMDELHQEKELYFVTQHGKPIAVLMDIARYEMMMDLLEDREDERDSMLGMRIAEARTEYKSTGGIPVKPATTKKKKH